MCANRQPSEEYSNIVLPFHVATVEIPKKQTGAAAGSRHLSAVGTYETWICAGCGFTEWYAQDAAELLDRLARIPGSGVRVVGDS